MGPYASMPECQAGKSGVTAGTSTVNAEAFWVSLALLHQEMGRIAAVIHIHNTPLAA